MRPCACSRGGLELAGAGEVLRALHGPEGDDGHFHALGAEAVGLQLFLEGLQAGIEFLDLVAGHGAGDIQQQQAGAARLGVIGELGSGKGIGFGVHGAVLVDKDRRILAAVPKRLLPLLTAA